MSGPLPEEAPPAPFHLVLPARPETLAHVRRAVESAGARAQLPRPVIDDMRLAVTEACTNVVRHAYDAGGCTVPEFEVRLDPAPGAMRVVIEDQGRGLGPSPDVAGPGLGLSLIASLASQIEVDRGRERGTRLSMCFGGQA